MATAPRVGAKRIIQPRKVEETAALPRCAEVQPNTPFTLLHYYDWEYAPDCPAFDEAGEPVDGGPVGHWLPKLNTCHHQLGANGVVLNGAGELNPGAALQGHKAKRCVIVENGDTRLGPFATYLAAYDIRGGGQKWVLAGVEYGLHRGGRSARKVRDRTFEYGLRTFMHRHGVVPVMTEELLEEKIDDARRRLAVTRRAVDNGQRNEDAYRRRAEQIESDIEQWTEAYERQFGGSEPPTAPTVKPQAVKPKPKRITKADA